jgi:hypothetical protein
VRDIEAMREARRRWGELGGAWLPKAGWRKKEGGPFHPSENRFGEVFVTTPENPPVVRHGRFMYEVGRFETKGKMLTFVVIGRGMTWEEAFASAEG